MDFETAFLNSTNIKDSVHRGWGGGGPGGWEAEGGLNQSWAQRQSYCVFSKTQKQPQCSYLSGQDGCWQQFDTACSLISAP